MNEDKASVLVFDSSEGLVVLNPQSLREMSLDAAQEFMDWVEKLQASYLKPRYCPFCGGPEA